MERRNSQRSFAFAQDDKLLDKKWLVERLIALSSWKQPCVIDAGGGASHTPLPTTLEMRDTLQFPKKFLFTVLLIRRISVSNKGRAFAAGETKWEQIFNFILPSRCRFIES
jgi:hypothetical protein